MQFSANLGYLFKEFSLPDAIRAAASTGFDGVECHYPYEYSYQEINTALLETRLPMIGLNTPRGDIKSEEFGLSAMVGREDDARQSIDQAIEYAKKIDCHNVHVLAGRVKD